MGLANTLGLLRYAQARSTGRKPRPAGTSKLVKILKTCNILIPPSLRNSAHSLKPQNTS